jgi:hypothetical protein
VELLAGLLEMLDSISHPFGGFHYLAKLNSLSATKSYTKPAQPQYLHPFGQIFIGSDIQHTANLGVQFNGNCPTLKC